MLYQYLGKQYLRAYLFSVVVLMQC